MPRPSTAPRPYLALIGDLVASRERPDRAQLEGRLATFLPDLSRRLRPALAAEVVQTAGDEIQALFRDPAAVADAIVATTELLFGAAHEPIRFGLGYGPITTGPIQARHVANVGLVDGPCFHHARAAVEEARRRKVWAVAAGFGDLEDAVLTSLLELMGALRSRWTAHQGLAVYRMRGHARQKDLALALEISPSVLSERLRSAHYRELLRGEDALRSMLASVGARAAREQE